MRLFKFLEFTNDGNAAEAMVAGLRDPCSKGEKGLENVTSSANNREDPNLIG